MINWLRLVVTCAGIMCATHIFASTGLLPNQQDDPNGCGTLISQGNSNPPQGSIDQSTIDKIQSCLANCDQLYQSYADQNDYEDMNTGITYCRANLTALYNQSVFMQANANLTPKTTSTKGSASGQDAMIIPSGSTEPATQSSLIHQGLQSNETARTEQNTAPAPSSSTESSQPNTNSNQSTSEQKQQVNWF